MIKVKKSLHILECLIDTNIFDKHKQFIVIKPQYTIRKAKKLGGVDLAFLEDPKIGGRYMIGSYIREIYGGQNEIVKQLRSWQGFEPHAEWISRLEKPYVREESKDQ